MFLPPTPQTLPFFLALPSVLVACLIIYGLLWVVHPISLQKTLNQPLCVPWDLLVPGFPAPVTGTEKSWMGHFTVSELHSSIALSYGPRRDFALKVLESLLGSHGKVAW